MAKINVDNLGPIEALVVTFPDNSQFRGDMARALRDILDKDLIRIIDLIIVTKDQGGVLSIMNLSDLNPDDKQTFDVIVAQDARGLIQDKDAQKWADKMKNNTSAAMMLFEHTWARDFVRAINGAKGELIVDERIPKERVQELINKLQ